MVTDTVYIPPNIRIVGEAVSAVIMGAGPKFSDINNPRPVVQIGSTGQTGYVEISDIMVSTQGGTSGAILIEYNLNTPTSSPPSGLWDVHVRVGGFAGSNLQINDCPKTPDVPTAPNPACIAAYMSFHITRTAGNLYVAGSWIWAADHVQTVPSRISLMSIAVNTWTGHRRRQQHANQRLRGTRSAYRIAAGPHIASRHGGRAPRPLSVPARQHA
jgi:hypothetical protein